MSEFIRAFHRSDKAWYAENSDIRLPEISIGIYDDDGEGCAAEFTVTWIELAGKFVPQLQIFDDAWKMFAEMKDLTDELAKYDGKSISADKFSEILLSLGFKDKTEYAMPEKYQLSRKKKISFIDSHYKPLFSIEDGGEIEIEMEPGEWERSVCIYIDEYHFRFGEENGRIYHIREFAQAMESACRAYRPVLQGGAA